MLPGLQPASQPLGAARRCGSERGRRAGVGLPHGKCVCWLWFCQIKVDKAIYCSLKK